MDHRNIQKTVYKVSDFISWQRNGSLELSPSFQRRPVWRPDAKSFLIDTVIKGLPIPMIFLREQTNLKTLEPKREVVDGQQRIRTLFSFIEPGLLNDFLQSRDEFEIKKTHNPKLAGKTFQQLGKEDRKAILNYSFSVHILPSDTEDREVLQIFARMNATGVNLNHQELRNAEFYGVFKNLMYKLAYTQLERWRRWGLFSENQIARMDEVEETSDLVITMLTGIHGKSRSLLDKTYRDHENSFDQEKEVTRRFETLMDEIDATVGSDLSKTEFRKRTLFGSLASFYYDKMYGLDSRLVRVDPKPMSKRMTTVLKVASDRIKRGDLPDKLRKALRGAVGNVGARKERLMFLETTFNKI
ncbi:DUF262 domain-containing protein [bacterium]|nr:DUF262 domain-containing protein [bacterium]